MLGSQLIEAPVAGDAHGTSFLLRRSLPSIIGLAAVLVAVGVIAGDAVWQLVLVAALFVSFGYALGPLVIERLIPARVIPHDGTRYLTDDRVGVVLARRCADAGLPLVTFGIVEDGTPNAFTFGRSRQSARVWVTRGLLDRLDDRELDAVVCHELGHVKHRDFVVMTLAAFVPMLCYLLFRAAIDAAEDDDGDDDDGGGFFVLVVGTFLVYFLSELLVLSLSRAREYAADHWSCRCTGNGDALVSALVKIAYGIGEVADARQVQEEAVEQDDQRREAEARALKGRAKREANRARRQATEQARKSQKEANLRARRMASIRALGIADPRPGRKASATADGVDLERAAAAMRWESLSRWAVLMEKFSSHPLVVRRIEALESSRLPGAPARFAIVRALAGSTTGAGRQRRRAAFEACIALAPWVALAAAPFAGARSVQLAGAVLLASGVCFLVKQGRKFPAGFEPSQVAPLLGRLDAGPVAGIAVELRGRLIGRGIPGYVLSPDLVLQDATGFVPLVYRSPLPFVGGLFGLFRAQGFLGREVVAHGWYHRGPQPSVELRRVETGDGRAARTWWWVACWIASAAVALAGAVVLVVGGL